MTPLAMIDAGVQAIRTRNNGRLTDTAAAAVAIAWAALAEALLHEQDSTRVPPMDTERAKHLDTVRPGPHHPTLFTPHPWCFVSDCQAPPTHTIQGPGINDARSVCQHHFTEWSQARPI